MNLDQLFKDAIARYPKADEYKYQVNIILEQRPRSILCQLHI